MSEHEIQSGPSPEEAFAALTQLASVFLQGGRGPRADVAPPEDASGHRTATVVVDDEGRLQGLDSEAERLLGQSSSDVLGSPAAAFFGKLPATGESASCQVYRRDGAARAIWVSRSRMFLGGNACTVLTLNEHDSVGNRRTELRYRHLVEQIPAVVFTAALDGGLFDIYVSPQVETLLGYSQAQWVADPVLWYERLHPDDRRKLDAEFARGCATGGPFKAECRFFTRDDRVVWVHGEARLITDARGLPLLVQGVAFDITETKRAEELANASLREKETLLKEIHHRVKNNLQVTSSLLRLQSDHIDDESAKRALRDSQSRIRSMALVHELLYRSKDLANVDLGTYIGDLTRQLLRSHAAEGNVRVVSRFVPVPLPIDLAVPCGLILNELVSNALKHAFPAGRGGTITIELNPAERWSDLVVRDDGVGMSAAAHAGTTATLGVRLIQTLAEQIDAKLDVRSNDHGTEVRLRIPRTGEDRE